MTKEFNNWLIDIKNDLHQHPELSRKETRTTQMICRTLDALNIPVSVFDDLTGAVGVISGRADTVQGPVIALRADIDALPLQEEKQSPFKSKNTGVMHACGHDANTAIALGVARKIMESGLQNKINGHIKLIFQPAEEKLGGSLAMIQRGVLENPKVDRIIAGHMDPNLAIKTVGVFDRIGHAASDPFELSITGKGCHGARPHTGANPITAGGMFVSALDGIVLRHVSPADTAVISVGSFQAGSAGNVIPETAVLKGSVRTHTPEVREQVLTAIKDLAKGIAATFNIQCKLTFGPGAPLGQNDREASRSLFQASCQVLGKENVNRLPFIMGSDDFYFFTQKCPGAMMRFGCRAENSVAAPLHSPKFHVEDSALEIGVNVLFRAVENFFKEV